MMLSGLNFNKGLGLTPLPHFPDSSDTTPLLNNSSQDRMFETMAVEIEQLLAKVTPVLMADTVPAPGMRAHGIPVSSSAHRGE